MESTRGLAVIELSAWSVPNAPNVLNVLSAWNAMVEDVETPLRETQTDFSSV